MLRENEGVISFIPGSKLKESLLRPPTRICSHFVSCGILTCTGRRNGQIVLGRLVVHDRIEVEATVLPRYFNHSSFASLRRQLNYFSFVRLGKGRQRESTYVNDGVIEVDDILNLRRRSAGIGGITPHQQHQQKQEVQEKSVRAVESTLPVKNYVESIVPVVHLPSNFARISKSAAAKRAKRAKHVKKKIILTPSVAARNAHPFVSEDEESQGMGSSRVALDLTKPNTKLPTTDLELLEGCTALLGLSGKLWG